MGLLPSRRMVVVKNKFDWELSREGESTHVTSAIA